MTDAPIERRVVNLRDPIFDPCPVSGEPVNGISTDGINYDPPLTYLSPCKHRVKLISGHYELAESPTLTLRYHHFIYEALS